MQATWVETNFSGGSVGPQERSQRKSDLCAHAALESARQGLRLTHALVARPPPFDLTHALVIGDVVELL